MTQENERILDLCRKVSKEHDGGKMTELVRQLNTELDKLSPKAESNRAAPTKMPSPDEEHKAAHRA